MKKLVLLSFFILDFLSAVSFAADFEDKLILPDLTDERFILITDGRVPLGYCNNDDSQPVFIEIYIELNPDGSKENMIAAFFKSMMVDYPFVISMWNVADKPIDGIVYLDAEEDGIFEAVGKMGSSEADNIVCSNYPVVK